MVECYTCGVVKHVKEMHNGHFQSRKHYATRWLHEDYISNCKPQCPKCNLYSEGEKWIFGKKLEAEYGTEQVENLVKLSHTTVKYTIADYKYLIDYYTKKLKDIYENS